MGGDLEGKLGIVQQLSSELTIRHNLKALRSSAFKLCLGLGLSAKHRKSLKIQGAD